MADDADRADAQIEQQLEAARSVRQPSLSYTGRCHYCGAITGGGRRFCDADCRDDWQRDRIARARNG
jgi:hypothetical protein